MCSKNIAHASRSRGQFIVSQHEVVKRVCPRGPCRSRRFSARSARLAACTGLRAYRKYCWSVTLSRSLPQKIRTFCDIDVTRNVTVIIETKTLTMIN